MEATLEAPAPSFRGLFSRSSSNQVFIKLSTTSGAMFMVGEDNETKYDTDLWLWDANHG